MGAIIDFFTGIADFVTGAIDFLIGIISDIVYLVQLTAKAVAGIPSYFSWVPPQILALLLTIFGIVVLYKILGRE